MEKTDSLTQVGNIDRSTGVAIGPEARAYVIQFDYHPTVYNCLPSPLELYKEIICRLRENLTPSQPTNVPPLAYYAWIRPSHLPSVDLGVVEVWISLVSSIGQPIRLIDLRPPQVIAGTALSCRPLKSRTIGPFGVLPAISYTVERNADTNWGQIQQPPQISYIVEGTDLVRTDLYVLRTLPKDVESLFTPLVDQRHLSGAIDRCLATANPDTIPFRLAIVDEWGTGRSRALDECVRTARMRKFEVLRGTAERNARGNLGLDPIREAINIAVGLPSDDLGKDLERLVQWLEPDNHHHLAVDGIAFLAQYLREGVDKPENLAAVVTCILQRACSNPVLIAIDDLDQSPPITKALLENLFDQVPHIKQAQLTVCVTYDLANASDWSKLFQDGAVSLKELEAADVLKFVDSWFPELEYPPDQRSPLAHFLGNRPLLVRQSLKYLSHTGHIELDKGHWVLHWDYQDLKPPVKFPNKDKAGFDALLREYHELLKSDRKWVAKGLRLAAAIGADFEYNLWLEAMSRHPDRNIAEHAYDMREALEEHEFIRPICDDQDRDMYSITPAILWQAIWQEIQGDKTLAGELHGLLAQLLAERMEQGREVAGQLAHQILWSRKRSEMPKAFDLFCKLADHNSGRQCLHDAVAFYQRALEAANKSQGGISPALICQTQYKLADALNAWGRRKEAVDLACQAAESCTQLGTDKYPLAAESWILAGWIHQELDEIGQAQTCYDRAADLVHACPMVEIEARLLRKQATCYSKQKLGDEALVLYERALQLKQSPEDLVQAQASYATLLERRGRLAEARHYLEMAMERCDQLPPLYASRIHIQVGTFDYKTSDLRSAQTHFDKALALAQSIGAVDEWAEAESWLGTIGSDLEGKKTSHATLLHYASAAELFEYLKNRTALARVVKEYALVLVSASRFRETLYVIERADWLGIVDNEIEELRREVETFLAKQEINHIIKH